MLSPAGPSGRAHRARRGGGIPAAGSRSGGIPLSTTPVPGESRTRDKVLQAVVERGPVTAREVAAQLGMTATGVRRHLDALQHTGAVREAPRPGQRPRRGRPARAYVASEGGHAQLTDDSPDVATAALHFLQEQAGPQAVALFARRQVADLEARYGEALAAAGPSLQARVEALALALAEDGFAATARPQKLPGGWGIQLCQGHCPVRHVAAEFPQFCEAETEAFGRLLGAHVQRLTTLAGGGHVCTTFVPGEPCPPDEAIDEPDDIPTDERTP